jgi:hypothetical protein
MTNTNCLDGIRCPHCGSEDRFRIEAKTVFTVTDDGTDDHGDVEWDDGSYAECTECHHSGMLKDFRADDGEADSGGNASPPDETRTVRIEVRGGVVQEVSNLPPGWAYHIVDYDDAEENA